MDDDVKGILLELSTDVEPAKLFTIDGEEFKLYGLNHLSEKDETEALALFARHGILVARLESSANVNKGKQMAEEVKRCRLQLLTRLTSAPMDKLSVLPLGEQVKLFKAVQEEIGDDGDVEGIGGGKFQEGDEERRERDIVEDEFLQ